jgi:DNA-binding NtrC family response regulator
LSLWAKRAGARVLLIDDDEGIRDALRLFFEDQGCIFTAVGRAEYALEELTRNSFDIILLDYKLPGMNVVELLARIRDTHPEVAKIFITGYSGEDIFSRAREAGEVGFVRKPLTAEKIEECLAGIDHRSRTAGPRSDNVTE